MHQYSNICPKCQEDLSRVALTKVVSTFESCDCGDPEFTHLVEQSWHKTCFLQQAPANHQYEPVAPVVGQSWPIP